MERRLNCDLKHGLAVLLDLKQMDFGDPREEFHGVYECDLMELALMGLVTYRHKWWRGVHRYRLTAAGRLMALELRAAAAKSCREGVDNPPPYLYTRNRATRVQS